MAESSFELVFVSPNIAKILLIMFCDALFGGYECLSYNKRESHVKSLNKAYEMARAAG